MSNTLSVVGGYISVVLPRQAASDLGVPEATQLALHSMPALHDNGKELSKAKEVAAHFYACAQLAKHARHVAVSPAESGMLVADSAEAHSVTRQVRLGPSTPRTKGASLVFRLNPLSR